MTQYDLVGATGCATGVAHTFMAEEALEKAAEKLGYSIKIETHGQTGVEHELSPEEIKNAKGVVIASDVDVDPDRFAGKRAVIVPVAKGIKEPETLIKEALNPDELPDSDITIVTDDMFKTTITCEKSKFNIIGKSGEDFSYLPSIEKIDSIIVSQFTLKEVVRQTIFSIADNDNNKLMTGELFEINEDILKVVSLDGHRISIRKIRLKNFYMPKKVVVPGKTLNEISKILSGDMDSEVHIFFTDKHIVFEFDHTTVVSRLIEGDYFKIDQMLSSDYETKVRINKKEFLNCIDRATLLVKEGDKKPIIINIMDGMMELKINSAVGSMNEEIDIEKKGKDIMIGFNPKFLIDALRVIEDEEIDIYLVNPKAPCFIRDAEEKYIYLILPVNFTTVN